MPRNPVAPAVRRRLLWGLGAMVAVVAATATPVRAETVEVAISGSAFVPASAPVRLTAGEPAAPEPHAHVIWRNQDPGLEHTVTFDNVRLVSSGRLATGQGHEVVFPLAGTFPYRCTIHPTMTGSVVVAPAPPTTTAAARSTTTGEGGGSGSGAVPIVIGVSAVATLAVLAWFLVRRRREAAGSSGP